MWGMLHYETPQGQHKTRLWRWWTHAGWNSGLFGVLNVLGFVFVFLGGVYILLIHLKKVRYVALLNILRHAQISTFHADVIDR